MTTEPIPTANELSLERTGMSDERTRLSVTRTIVSLDRTLMAWIRTATSLISFGFTIYKVFQQIEADTPARTSRLLEPRGVALVLMGLGIGGLVAATLQYRRDMRMMQERYKQYGPFHGSISASVATVLAGLGILGFVLVFLRQ